MKKILLIASVGLFFLACAKMETPVENKAHPADWANPRAEEFHAFKVVATGAVSCISCHGQDLSANQSFCIDCHNKQDRPISYPHPAYWLDFKSAENHGAFVKQNEGLLTCNNCHDGQNDQTTPCANCHIGGN
ncbi:cytochrome c3 family protein [Caldithrix abyssi]